MSSYLFPSAADGPPVELVAYRLADLLAWIDDHTETPEGHLPDGLSLILAAASVFNCAHFARVLWAACEMSCRAFSRDWLRSA